MYALVLIRYTAPMDKVAEATPAHRAYLGTLNDQGYLLVSGPFDPRTGGAILLRLPDDRAGLLEEIRDNDPFYKQNLAEYRLERWAPTNGLEALDRL